MTDLPDLDDSGVYTFESAEQDPIKGWSFEEDINEDISTELPPRSEVLECVVTSRELSCGDSLDGRIAKVAQEIEFLREEVGSDPVATVERKLQELKQQKSLSTYRSAAYSHKTHTLESLEGLSRAESRITRLEKLIGPQQPPAPLSLIVSQLKQKLDLLSLNPQQIEDAVASLKSQVVPNDRVSAVYDRLESLGPVLSSLPQIVDRLKSLEILHMDAAASHSFLRDAEATIRQMATDIEHWNTRLDKIEDKLQNSATS